MNLGARTAAWSGGISAKSYVQDGLIAMWDGIENAGWGTHDASATTWKDLMGGTTPTTLSVGSFGDTFFAVSADTSTSVEIATSDEIKSEPVICLQAVIGFSAGRSYKNVFCGIYAAGNRGFALDSRSAYSVWAIGSYNNSRWEGYSGGSTNGYSGFVAKSPFCITAYSPNNASPTVSMSNSTLTYNEGWASGDATNDTIIISSNCTGSKFYNIRLYNRALTAAEIAHNYAIDKARFGLT